MVILNWQLGEKFSGKHVIVLMDVESPTMETAKDTYQRENRCSKHRQRYP